MPTSVLALAHLCSVLLVLAPPTVEAPDRPDGDEVLEVVGDGVSVEEVSTAPCCKGDDRHADDPQRGADLGAARVADDGRPEYCKGDGLVDEEEEEHEVQTVAESSFCQCQLQDRIDMVAIFGVD